MSHILGCLYIIFDQLLSDEEVYKEGISDNDVYIEAFFFMFASVLGQGSEALPSDTSGEQVVLLIMMLVGTITISVASGSMAALFALQDS